MPAFEIQDSADFFGDSDADLTNGTRPSISYEHVFRPKTCFWRTGMGTLTDFLKAVSPNPSARNRMPFATALEITAAYQKLSPQENMKITRYAARKIPGTSFSEPLDLIHETLARAYEGNRKWPREVPFGLFVCLAMRSISEADRSSNESHLVSLSAHERSSDRSATSPKPQQSIEDYLIRLENLEAASVAVDLARQSLTGDQKALHALEALLWGLTPRETCATFSLSEEEFDSARHRVSRRLREAGRVVVSKTMRSRSVRATQKPPTQAAAATPKAAPQSPLKATSRSTPTPRGTKRKM